MQKYLNYIKNKYSNFRYISDKNILENLEFFKNINYKIISNEIGFCIIFTDFRISKNTCFFGFLEIFEKSKSNLFLEEVKLESKNFIFRGLNPSVDKTILIGPINFSIWNSYRFGNFENNNDLILGEYETDKNLNKIFLENKFNIFEKYVTGSRTGENPYLLKLSTDDFSYFKDLKIEKVEINKKTIKNIFELSSEIFVKAPKISFKEFEKYIQVYLDLYKNNLGEFIIYYKNEQIGFLISFVTKDYFVIKTVGIKKEFRGKGFGNFILHYVYDYYLKLGLKKSYYLYMRENGDALNMTHKNAQKHREYFTYI